MEARRRGNVPEDCQEDVDEEVDAAACDGEGADGGDWLGMLDVYLSMDVWVSRVGIGRAGVLKIVMMIRRMALIILKYIFLSFLSRSLKSEV